jgi:hypothetical protein
MKLVRGDSIARNKQKAVVVARKVWEFILVFE